MNKLLPILLIGMLACTAYAAGTVTLTGTCQSNINRNGSINFSISNSGTDSASAVLLQSYSAFSNKLTGSYSANQIGPGRTAFFEINSSMGNRTGSFAYSFLLTYQQNTQIFTVVFPCVVQSNGTSASLAAISNVSVQDVNSTTEKISGSIYSFSQSPISGNLTLILPPALKPKSNTTISFTANPYSYYNFTLYANAPSQNNTYSGAVALQYSDNGTTHSYVSIIKIIPYSANQGQLKAYLIQGAILAVIAIILILVARQRIIKRKKQNVSQE